MRAGSCTVITENLVCMLTPAAAGTDLGYLKQPGKITVFCFAKRRAKRKRVSGREDIALVYQTTGSSSARDRRSLSGVALVSGMESSKLRTRDDAPTFWLLHDS